MGSNWLNINFVILHLFINYLTKPATRYFRWNIIIWFSRAKGAFGELMRNLENYVPWRKPTFRGHFMMQKVNQRLNIMVKKHGKVCNRAKWPIRARIWSVLFFFRALFAEMCYSNLKSFVLRRHVYVLLMDTTWRPSSNRNICHSVLLLKR